MEQHDEWFSPEDVEEQIARYLADQKQASTNARMLWDLQRLAEDDVQRVAQIRARLLSPQNYQQRGKSARERADHHPWHTEGVDRPVGPNGGERGKSMMDPRPGSHGAKRSSRFLVKVASGLVAVLLIGSMFFALTHFGARLGQTGMQRTAVTTSGVQNVHGISAFLVDTTSGKVLVDMNSHVRRPIANLASIMTAVVAIEDADPKQEILIEQTTLNTVPRGMKTAGLQAGDRILLQDLLYGLLLSGGNDVALVIAQGVGGNTQQFVAMMNDEAHQLQLNDTHFGDPYWSSATETYSSAADLGRLVNYAMQISPFFQIVTAQEHILSGTAQHHSYRWHRANMLQAAGSEINSIQVGYDKRAGACMVFFAQKNGHLLIGVELNAASEQAPSSDAARLLKGGSGG